jgi:two-component system, NtrC family, response regulator GlrR
VHVLAAWLRRGRAKRVLLVDDDADVLEGMRMSLEALLPEVQVLSATSGPSALDAIQRERPDVLVTDYRMPGMDGLELTRRTLASWPTLPIIMVSAFGHEVEEAARQANVRAFIPKPFDPQELASAVEANFA